MNALNSLNKNKSDASEGFKDGYLEGYRFGGCQAVLERIEKPKSPSKSQYRVLYVPQGFEAIDRGVIEALHDLTAECIVAPPESALTMAVSVRPDLVLVMNGLHVFPPDHEEQIRTIRGMGIHTAIWFVDDPYFTEDTVRIAQSYDVVFTHEIECAALYQKIGCQHVHYLPLAANPQMFRPIRSSPEYRYDICFIGNAFWNRVELFDQLASYLQDKKVFIAGQHWDRLTNYDQLTRFIRTDWIEPEETVSYYNGAKIVINIHRPTAAGSDNRNVMNLPGSSINPRTYEISGCGTLQITDIRSDLTLHYQPGYNIETFADAAELREKIDYYLTHDQERLHIAWRSLWTTRWKHTFHERVASLLAVLKTV
ncbi:CgeB family protein [Paenibacillus bouchesdurhonensis]|uniref:CgeB family protein n=1 Tax=Paenibacillus bouchesdurhonensis TaxID=1870990 RepID=UPI000DA617A0